MEKILKLYTYVDGTNDTPFPSADEQIIIGSFTYTANRMGSAPQIAATVKHRLCLDDLWNDKVYAEFNGEKYFVINTPSSSKSNDDTRYEHDLELLSEREILNHVYFIDAVQGDSDTDVYKSNSTKVLFYGDIQQFVGRLNASLSYRNLGYTAVIDDGVTSEDKQVSFEDKYILEALQEEFNIFEIPYYFVGKVIHFGYTSNAITTTFKYGHDDAFLSISKDNANYALINRITGVGSSDNIPYYYPNETDDQSAVEASGKKWITPSQNLMPSIYRESEGAEMFYEAKNNTYPDGEGGYYQFENEYSDTNPREGKTDFEDIKPTITGITNAAGQRIDMFVEFAYDTNDNDEVDEEGNYLHPYFFAKLRKTDGTYGFNLFDHAIESQTMQITFTSGICGACTFEIAVGEDTQKNLVQVGETSGALMRDEDGNVLCGREDLQQPQTPQDRQNDTQNYEVWIALRKDNSTYPQVMPNVNYNYKPSTSDTFAILGISLPQAYILKAEDELEKSLVKHMWMNNVEKFTFSAKFSRIFFTEHPEVLAQLNENARVLIEYNGKQHTLYIDNYTYKMDSGSPLPEIDIDLVDTLSVGQNSLQTQLDSIKQDILSTVGGADFLKQGLKYFLRKDTSDTAKGKITFVRGLDVGTFAENTSGGTFRVLEDLTTYAEVDRLRVRVKAYFETLEIINTNSVGGKMILTAGGGVYLREVKDRETLEDGTEQVWDFYRCYFLTEQDGREVENRFHVGDLAMSQSFNIKAGMHQGVTNHYYWREVVGIGDDYIDLSKTICDTGSDAPMAEDTVCHLGNRSDKDRQGAIIFSAVDVFSPSITLYYGINDFSLVNKDYVSYGVDKSTGNAFFRVYGEMYAGDREQTSYVKYTPGVGVEMRGKFLNQAGESYDTIIDSIQNAIDGNIETWFGEEEPTLSNEPAVNWTTDEDKNTHLGDLYYSDAGVAYRFQMEGAQYVWKMLKDSDITKALADAKAAKDAADAAQEAADAAADRLTAWASDGVISPTEKQGIKDEIARIDADKANITAQYTKYGLGTPTAFNNAYTAYRAVLVSLSASAPENIAIPSDFSSKQTYYYNERTSALGAIADASITSVNNVTEQLEQMQQDFAEVKEDVAGVKTSVDGLKNFTDEAFADGIVDRNESAAIASHINSIETFAKDAAESYTKVYENTLLTGTAKTNLANAYTAFTTAKTELVTTINGAIADGLVDALEKSAVDGKYTAFNTKYGDFVANLNAANRAIQDAINQNALQALQKIGELDYLKAALKEFTTIEGGLIQSSTLALGYTSDSGYQVMAGTNGIYDASKLGGGIASWWGGAMFDRFEYTEETMPENVASALVRMDGTGYFAKGNLWWESDGTLHADPLSFFVGEETVGDVLGLFQFVKSDAGIEYVIPQYPFQKLEIGNYLQIGKAQLYWDEANQAFYVRHQDGVSPVGFYATGFISTKGANPNAGGVVSGASSLEELSDVALSGLQDGQVLAYDTATQKWVNKSVSAGGMDEDALAEYLTTNQYAKKGDINIAGLTDLHSSWDALLKAQKPTTLAGYGIADGVNAVSVTGSGNVVTSASVSGHVLTLTKGLNALTAVSLATISDLHASWDALLKAAPTAYVTRWPTAAEVGALTQSTGDARYALTTGTNASGTWPISITGDAQTFRGYGTNSTWGGVVVVRVDGVAEMGRYIDFHYADDDSNDYSIRLQVPNVANQTVVLPSSSGTIALTTSNVASASKLQTSQTIWGRPFNGTAPVSGNMTGVGSISASGNITTDNALFQIDATNISDDRGLNVLYNGQRLFCGFGTSGSKGLFITQGSSPGWVLSVPSATVVAIAQNSGINVGIGTTSPSYKLHVAGDIYSTTSFRLGNGTITWDSTNNCFHFSHGLYSDSFVSAKGANSSAGGTVSGVTKLSDLSDVQLGTLATNQVLSWNGSKWVNKAVSTGLDETALAQYLTNNQYLTMPTGDGRYALKGGSNATGTWPISITGNAATATKLAIQDTRSVNTAPFAYGRGLVYLFKHNTADGLSDGGTYHSVLQFDQWAESSGGLCKQLALTDGGNMWFRTASSATAWGSWKKLLDSSNYASTLDNRYVTLSTAQTISGKKTFTAQPTIVGSGLFWGKRMTVNTSNYEDAICWLDTSLTKIAKIGYHNTEQRIIINPIASTEPWVDAVGKYSLIIGNNKLTYNTYPILTSNNYASTLDSRYVKKAGDTMTGNLIVKAAPGGNGIATFNNPNNTESFIYIQSQGVNKGAFITNNSIYGTSIFDQTSSKYLGIKTDGTPHFQGNALWHAGNDGSGSGLDADLLDGRQGTSYGIMWGGMATSTDPGADDATSTSITDFLTRLNYSGIFGSGFGVMRGSWYYVGNTQYNTGVGTLEMAGTAVLNMSHYADTSANYKTLLFLEGPTGNMYSYVSQSSGNAHWSRYAKTTDNVYSATRLQTARTINGTAFNGTSNIVTSYWGTARTLSLTGNATGSISMNGSSNVSMSVNVNYATSAGNADTLDGFHANIGSTPYGKVAVVATDGVLEIGRYIDWHYSNSGTSDYSVRLQIPNVSDVFVNMPSASGTLARTVDNVYSASKLQTEKEIFGHTFDGTQNVVGQALVYGSYTAASLKYANGGIQVREAGLVGSAQSDILYGPSIGFHWRGRVGSSITMDANGNFILYNQSYNGYRSFYAGAITASSNVTAPSFYASNWFRTTGQTGWYSETYGGGWYMTDTKYLRAYNNKSIRTSGVISAGEYQDDAYGYYNCTRPNTSGTFNCYAFVRQGTYAFGLGYNSSNQIILGSATSSKGISPWIYITSSGTYTDGYLSAKGQNTSSDLRLKDILCSVQPSLKDFAKAPLFRFAWKSDPGMVEIGSSAQYWRNVLPDTVKERDGWLEMGYGNIALAGVITIARDFETLEQRVDRLEKENGKLKKLIYKVTQKIK